MLWTAFWALHFIEKLHSNASCCPQLVHPAINVIVHCGVKLNGRIKPWHKASYRPQSSAWMDWDCLIVSIMKAEQLAVDLRFLQLTSHLPFAHRSCQSMTSLFSSTMSPVKDGTSSLPRRQTSFSKPPLRALYDLLIGPLEGVSF